MTPGAQVPVVSILDRDRPRPSEGCLAPSCLVHRPYQRVQPSWARTAPASPPWSTSSVASSPLTAESYGWTVPRRASRARERRPRGRPSGPPGAGAASGGTVAENVFLGDELAGRGGVLRRSRMRDRTVEVLTRLGVSIPPDLRVASLAVAQRQMVEIARALMGEARVVILDEPTAALARRGDSPLHGPP